ncbi:hypothetical protein L798_01027 [Zootermopsis nevadensis]|uniref:Uncharacterized protein n=1 Tax=Zootermopsis nevadensis TaxID=136037 RepID=A0A067QX47_ZOONE|nr:hypothetical protein L798_01027 [Zootermopsis nevadensis]
MLDVSGPSGRRTKTKLTTKTAKDMNQKKQAKRTPRSPLTTDFENSSSEISDTEITSIWQQCQEGAKVSATSPVAGPSGTQNLVVEAEVHCSQGQCAEINRLCYSVL